MFNIKKTNTTHTNGNFSFTHNHKVFAILAWCMLISTSIFLGYNKLYTHYQSIGLAFPNLWRQTIEGLLFFIGSYSISAKYQKIGTSLRAVGIFFLTIFCYSLIIISVSVTPNTQLIDLKLHHLDQMLGYNTLGEIGRAHV